MCKSWKDFKERVSESICALNRLLAEAGTFEKTASGAQKEVGTILFGN